MRYICIALACTSHMVFSVYERVSLGDLSIDNMYSSHIETTVQRISMHIAHQLEQDPPRIRWIDSNARPRITDDTVCIPNNPHLYYVLPHTVAFCTIWLLRSTQNAHITFPYEQLLQLTEYVYDSRKTTSHARVYTGYAIQIHPCPAIAYIGLETMKHKLTTCKHLSHRYYNRCVRNWNY